MGKNFISIILCAILISLIAYIQPKFEEKYCADEREGGIKTDISVLGSIALVTFLSIIIIFCAKNIIFSF